MSETIFVNIDGISHMSIGHMFVMAAIFCFIVAMLIGALGGYDDETSEAGAIGVGAVLACFLFLFLAAITWCVEHLSVVR